MKITSLLSISYLKKNKKRSIGMIVGVALAVMLMLVSIILLCSYQEYVLKVKRYERNWEAEFKNITYENALKIAEDENIKEISVIKNLGKSEENFNKDYDESRISVGSFKRIVLSIYNENAIKNNVKLIDGRLPEKENEIALSEKGWLKKEEINLGENIELTIAGEKKTYTLVRLYSKFANRCYRVWL